MTATETAAWWGAVISTLVLVLNIIKWIRSGPLVNVSVSPGMQIYNEGFGGFDKTIYIFVKATNNGDRNTTLTNLVGIHYTSIYKRIRKKENKIFVIPQPAHSQPLPHVLGPGEIWQGGIEQNVELEECSRNGYLLLGINHSSGKKPVLQRLVINKIDA